jgi:hypothetical protein
MTTDTRSRLEANYAAATGEEGSSESDAPEASSTQGESEGGGEAQGQGETEAQASPAVSTESAGGGDSGGGAAGTTSGTTAAVPGAAAADGSVSEGGRDPSTGRFTKSGKPGASSATMAKPNGAAPTATAKPKTGAPGDATHGKPLNLEAPPQGWGPTAREEWAKVPPTARAEIHRRERETAVALDQSRQAREFHQQFAEVARPFEGIMQAQGVTNPLAAVQSLFQTAAALATLPAAPKAQLVARIIATHDVNPELLAKALTGEDVAGGRQQTVDVEAITQRAVQAARDSFHQERQQILNERAGQTAEQFLASKDFAGDVAPMMGTLMKAAAQNNQTLSLDDAYKAAIQLRPDLLAILTQRERQSQARNAQASTERAKAAASSIRSQPTSSVRTEPKNTRSLLESNWLNASSG